MAIRPVKGKTQREIMAEWDDISSLRFEQINSGHDITLRHVLVPTVLELIANCNRSRVLDVGCGSGFLTAKLAEQSAQIIAIDISRRNIELARSTYSDECLNVKFLHQSVESLGESPHDQPFTLAIANMSLISMMNLNKALHSVSAVLEQRAHFVFTVTHPWFWSQYWGYADADWFDYKEEIVIEAPFRISLETTDSITTHVHRSFEQYLSCLSHNGFTVETVIEPMPPPTANALYPARWRYPRYLAVRCVKIK